MPYFFWTLVPPPSGTLPPPIMAWPPISFSASTRIMEQPASHATIAAGSPVAPAPITTTSASRSQSTGDCPVAAPTLGIYRRAPDGIARMPPRCCRSLVGGHVRIHRTGMGSVDHRGRGRAKSHFDFLVGAFTWNAALRNRWFADSLLEGDGFELPVPRSMQARLKAKIAGFGCMPPSILRLPSSVAISSGAKRNLGPEPLSGAEPEVRIHLPAAAAKSPREMPWLVPPSEARLNLRSPSATRARREADRFASRAADQV